MERKKTIPLAILAILITAGAQWVMHRPVVPKAATMQDVRAEARRGGYRLLTTEELAQWYRDGSEKILLVDTRQKWEYRTGHMKGAVNFPMEPTWWSRWRKAGALEKFLGPDKNRTIVFY